MVPLQSPAIHSVAILFERKMKSVIVATRKKTARTTVVTLVSTARSIADRARSSLRPSAGEEGLHDIARLAV